MDLDSPSRDYFAERSRSLRSSGLDPDDDDVWCRPATTTLSPSCVLVDAAE